MKKFIPLLLLATFISACSLKKDKLIEVTKDETQFTGVAVSKEGRIFLNYPDWIDNYKYPVVEVLKNSTKKFFPNERLNTGVGSPMDRFVCVQSVYVDKENFLWILDPANPQFKGVIEEGAKLFKVDLSNSQIIGKYIFKEPIISKNSYLNDIRVDTEKNIVYITDSGEGGIVILDLNNEVQRKVLTNHYSTMAEKDYIIKIGEKELRKEGDVLQVHSDGIALDTKNGYLYYHALTGKTLYRISTEVLNNETLTEDELEQHVEKVAETGAIDGLISDESGNIFLSCIEENAIKYYKPNGEIKTLIQDERIIWPDSFSIGSDGYLYFTISQINLMPWFNNDISKRKEPYKVFKINIKNLS